MQPPRSQGLNAVLELLLVCWSAQLHGMRMQLATGSACGWAQVFRVLGAQDVNVLMMSQGASKTNISLIVADAEANAVVCALHDEFF
jgi:aspartokinase